MLSGKHGRFAVSDFDFITYKASDFAYQYAMDKEFASCPKSGRSRRIRNPYREEAQRRFGLWDREVTRRQKAGEPFSDALMYREHYREEMLLWSQPR